MVLMPNGHSLAKWGKTHGAPRRESANGLHMNRTKEFLNEFARAIPI